MRVLACFLVIAQAAWSQSEPYQLPFASSGNVLELTVANSSSIATSNIAVEATNVPSWLNISPSVTLPLLKPGEEQAAEFMFSVDKSAPVNSAYTLTFVITNSRGESWTKDITISVSPPEKFELFQNYPNPFNPTTEIGYQLAATKSGMSEVRHVALKIYDILGREVAVLVDEIRPAGFHQERWDASRFASGMYIYQLTSNDAQGNSQVYRKTMMLVK